MTGEHHTPIAIVIDENDSARHDDDSALRHAYSTPRPRPARRPSPDAYCKSEYDTLAFPGPLGAVVNNETPSFRRKRMGWEVRLTIKMKLGWLRMLLG
jgi:hypothetical protein